MREGPTVHRGIDARGKRELKEGAKEKRSVEKLREPMETLTVKRRDVQGSVDWLESVDRLQTEVNLLHDGIHENRGCLQRGCSVTVWAKKRTMIFLKGDSLLSQIQFLLLA
ncbi:hypothetical protein NE237_003991 [Protea cynaroides]|uniref:Uncharacterized protein n=1 Tax=Protea cynaroides TaxID=273540 RepID=A0A9Q0KI21_9MAGN|nr:hypothetical protein NE237_003991 [Protea cynaroides]